MSIPETQATERPLQGRPRAGGLTVGAAALLLALCLIWGTNMIAIKVSNRGFPPILAASLRSAGATVLLCIWARRRGHTLAVDKRALLAGFVISVFFAAEFLFLYWGTELTLASRAVVLLYTSPLWTTLGAIFFLGEHARLARFLGLALSFAGIVAVFGASADGLGSGHLAGDGMEILAAVLWASSTILGKRSMEQGQLNPLQLLFYQVAFSAPLLFAASLGLEGVPQVDWRLDSILSLAHQTITVASVSYLAWFWLLSRYQASQVSSFTFLTPLFGVIFGGLLLGEPLTPLLWLGLAGVAAGIYLVNRPESPW